MKTGIAGNWKNTILNQNLFVDNLITTPKIDIYDMRTQKNTKNDWRWFVVPPYKPTSSWQVLNFHGELIAEFETYEHAQIAVELYNESQKNEKNEKYM